MKQIKQYQIKEEIGRGGMSTVYRAVDPTNGRTVAIKLMQERLSENKRAHERFIQEAEMVMALQHPAIVPVLEYGEIGLAAADGNESNAEAGRLYIIMNYMAGGSLRQRLDAGAIPFTECQQILAQIAPALDTTHAKNIIHRDIKPHNILLDKNGNAYLSDFGVARLLGNEGAEQTVTLVGTPEFIAPEQVNEGNLTWQTDIYQLGVTLFHMLTGQLPFNGSSLKIMIHHLTKPIPSAEALNSALPSGVDRVLRRAMAKEPQARYLSAGDLLNALMEINNSATVTELFTFPPHLQPTPTSAPAPQRVAAAVAHTPTPVPAHAPPYAKRSLRAIIGMGMMATVVGLSLFGVANFSQLTGGQTTETAVTVSEEDNEVIGVVEEALIPSQEQAVTDSNESEAADIAEESAESSNDEVNEVAATAPENNNPPPPPPNDGGNGQGGGNGNGRPDNGNGGRGNDGRRGGNGG